MPNYEIIESPTGPLALEDQICFALYNASRALTMRYREILSPLGLTYPQYLVLLVLWENGGATVNQIGARVQLDSGTLSPLLRRLESAGLITRTRLPADERSVHVALTPAGDALRDRASGIPQLICAATGLTPPDIQALQAQISMLAEHVRASA